MDSACRQGQWDWDSTESQAKIFGVFERLHSNEIYPGTGIGLAIVKRAVQRMNGRVVWSLNQQSEACSGWSWLPPTPQTREKQRSDFPAKQVNAGRNEFRDSLKE